MKQTPLNQLLAFVVNAPYGDLEKVECKARKGLSSGIISDAVATVLNHHLVTQCRVEYAQAFTAKHNYESVFGVTEAVFTDLRLYFEWLQEVKRLSSKCDLRRIELVSCFMRAREIELDSCGALALVAEVMSSKGLPIPIDLALLQEKARRRHLREGRNQIIRAKVARLTALYHRLQDPEIMRNLGNLSPVI